MEALENALSMAPESAGKFPQISGFNVLYDSREEPFKRVLKVEPWGGSPFNPDKDYIVTTTEYIGRVGGDGFSAFNDSKILTNLENTISVPRAMYEQNKNFSYLKNDIFKVLAPTNASLQLRRSKTLLKACDMKRRRLKLLNADHAVRSEQGFIKIAPKVTGRTID